MVILILLDSLNLPLFKVLLYALLVLLKLEGNPLAVEAFANDCCHRPPGQQRQTLLPPSRVGGLVAANKKPPSKQTSTSSAKKAATTAGAAAGRRNLRAAASSDGSNSSGDIDDEDDNSDSDDDRGPSTAVERKNKPYRGEALIRHARLSKEVKALFKRAKQQVEGTAAGAQKVNIPPIAQEVPGQLALLNSVLGVKGGGGRDTSCTGRGSNSSSSSSFQKTNKNHSLFQKSPEAMWRGSDLNCVGWRQVSLEVNPSSSSSTSGPTPTSSSTGTTFPMPGDDAAVTTPKDIDLTLSPLKPPVSSTAETCADVEVAVGLPGSSSSASSSSSSYSSASASSASSSSLTYHTSSPLPTSSSSTPLPSSSPQQPPLPRSHPSDASLIGQHEMFAVEAIPKGRLIPWVSSRIRVLGEKYSSSSSSSSPSSRSSNGKRNGGSVKGTGKNSPAVGGGDGAYRASAITGNVVHDDKKRAPIGEAAYEFQFLWRGQTLVSSPNMRTAAPYANDYCGPDRSVEQKRRTAHRQNMRFCVVGDAYGRPFVFLLAIKDIPKGHTCWLDYGDGYWEHWLEKNNRTKRRRNKNLVMGLGTGGDDSSAECGNDEDSDGTHPPFSDIVKTALFVLQEVKGSTRKTLFRYICASYEGFFSADKCSKSLTRTLQSLVVKKEVTSSPFQNTFNLAPQVYVELMERSAVATTAATSSIVSSALPVVATSPLEQSNVQNHSAPPNPVSPHDFLPAATTTTITTITNNNDEGEKNDPQPYDATIQEWVYQHKRLPKAAELMHVLAKTNRDLRNKGLVEIGDKALRQSIVR